VPLPPPLYAVLDVDAVGERSLEPRRVAAAWLDAGVRWLQLRAKALDGGALLELADTLAALSRQAGATFIVNDRADVARLSDAGGVHLGQTDLRPVDARKILPAGRLIGVSTHSVEQAKAALSEPVDYLAIGPVFGTSTKARPDPEVGLDGVRAVSVLARARRRPVVAIGGITLARAPEVLAAGADSVAVIADLLHGDPGERARAFLQALGDAPA